MKHPASEHRAGRMRGARCAHEIMAWSDRRWPSRWLLTAAGCTHLPAPRCALHTARASAGARACRQHALLPYTQYAARTSYQLPMDVYDDATITAIIVTYISILYIAAIFLWFTTKVFSTIYYNQLRSAQHSAGMAAISADFTGSTKIAPPQDSGALPSTHPPP